MQSPQALLRVYIESGLRAHGQGDIDAAMTACRQALEIAPENPDALNLMGAALMVLGQSERALGFFQRAARQRRNDPGVLGNLAQAHFALGQYDEARETFRKASRLDPRAMQFQLGIANSLAMQGKFGDAETLLQKLADRFPDHALVWFNLGNVRRDQKRPTQAVDCYIKALQIDPGFVDARNNLGSALQALVRYEDAVREYRTCIAQAPDHMSARCNLASVLIDLGRFKEAEEVLHEVIQLAPDMSEARLFLGAALGHQGRLREALAQFRAAAQIEPNKPQVAEVYAAALIENGHLRQGMRWLSRALALNPESPTPHQMVSYALLSHGQLVDGWAEYSHRPAFTRLHKKYSDVTTLSRTLPPDIRGKKVCLLREQGLGDEIFFLRFVPQLAAAGARVTYHASAKLSSLLRRVACLEQVAEQTAPVPPADAVMLLGDLPRALSSYPCSPLPVAAAHEPELGMHEFSRRISVFWPPIPPSLVLHPLETCLAAMRRRLAEAGAPPYAGLTWEGGTPPEVQQDGAEWLLYKQIGIEPFAGALREFPGTILALQRNPRPGEIDTFSRILGRRVHDFSDLNEDLESMLAALALMDEYIGVSNTNMHLRAAVGRTARVLIPCPAEWRWMASGSSSPWFPGFSLYRQSLDGDWDAALTSLRRHLRDIAQ